MRSKTVTELHQAFLTRGGFANSTVWTLANFIELLNTAVAEVWQLLADSWGDYFVYEDTSVSTAVGTDTYAMPAAFWRLRLLEVSRSATGATVQEYVPLCRVGMEKLNAYRRLSGEPTVYSLRGVLVSAVPVPKVLLGPVPSAVRKIRITYIPTAPTFTTGADTFDGIVGYEKLVLELCLYDAYKRSKMPVQECAQEIARLTENLKTTAPNRDAYQAETIAEHMALGQAADYWEDDL